MELSMLQGYEELQFNVIILNNTSGTELLDYEKLSLVTLDRDRCSFIIPKQQCVKGHLLTIYFFKDSKSLQISGSKNHRTIKGQITSVIAKVEDVELLKGKTRQDHKDKIEVKFVEYVPQEWNKIIEALLERQNEITTTFDDIKN